MEHQRNRQSLKKPLKNENLGHVVEMYICEIAHIILHPNQQYIFRTHPTCQKCLNYLKGEK